METDAISQLNHWKGSSDVQISFPLKQLQKTFHVHPASMLNTNCPGVFAVHLIYIAPLSWWEDLATA